ncbi:MAG TPA: hypothetical protein VMX57_08855, partial [Planctomycetota bacterium]|nr:hypothetical protein [Planctomycetota bacterium]
MRKATWLIVAVLACGVTYATDYTWNGTLDDDDPNPADSNKPYGMRPGQPWDNGVYWTGGTGADSDYPDDEGDRAYLTNGTSVHLATSTPDTLTLGEVYASGDTHFFNQSDYPRTWILSDNVHSGNWWWLSSASGSSWNAQSTTWEIYGNFLHNAGTLPVDPAYYHTIKMMRDGTAIRGRYGDPTINLEIYGTGVWDNGSANRDFPRNTVTVMSGASIGASATVTGNWVARTYVFPDGQANLPAYGSNVNFTYGYEFNVDNAPGRLAVTSGVTYPQDVTLGGGWLGLVTHNGEYNWELRPYAVGQSADLKVARDLTVSEWNTAYGIAYLNTVENGTTNSGNVHVGRDLLVSTGRTEDDINFGLKLNDSEVRVGRDLVIGSADGAWGGWHPVNRAAIKLMNSTIRIGRHLTINRPSDDIKAFGSGRVPWDAGTSTIIFDGNGLSGITQTVRAWGAETPLHNVVIDTLGTVQIDTYTWGGMPTGEAPSWVGQDNALRNCELYLTGNLSVLNGTFNQNDRLIIFNGP